MEFLSKQAHAANGALPTAPDYGYERDRAGTRRAEMEIARPASHARVQWGLALSGGGIRSATFCLGALQGMEKSHIPLAAGPAGGESSVLRQFDYVSTVSGGGYIGSFFSSLFIPGRLDRPATDPAPARVPPSDKDVAQQAYRVFTEDPPTRLRHDIFYDTHHPGRAALAWLRENGRYLTPTGAGDMAYAMAVQIRNWCATHYVLGTVFLGLLAFLAAVRALLVHLGLPSGGSAPVAALAYVAAYERQALAAVLAAKDLALGMDAIWWSPFRWFFLPLLALWLLPCGLAYWLTHPNVGGRLTDKTTSWSFASKVCLGLGALLLLAGGGLAQSGPAWAPVATLLTAGGLLVAMGILWFAATAAGSDTIANQRVMLTRSLAQGLLAAVMTAAITVIDTSAQTLYLQHARIWPLLSPAFVAGTMMWLVRRVASLASERKTPSWLSRLPIGVIAAVAGVMVALLVAVMWALAVQWLQWRGAAPDDQVFASREAHLPTLAAIGLTLLLATVLAIATGRFPGFLNLSTLQGLYSARLTRAYLGASNSRRFEPGNASQRSVTEPVAGDQVELADLYRNPLGPMHLINTCMNLTSDPAEQLVQRDRKGKPLAVVPGGLSYDNETHPMPVHQGRSEASAPLTVGEWVGVSGAAFSTGLGRSTSLGVSLLLGLANVRLGRWWPSGIRLADLKVQDVGWRGLFKTQIYLVEEFLGRFYGTRREWQYLSDGGHFENTGAYELLRPQRQIKLIVICDCGADPDYEFTDLANLTRLARIDFGIELEVDENIGEQPELKDVFGTPEDFHTGKAGLLPTHNKCAVLINVYHANIGPKIEGVARAAQPDARIILLKPRLLSTSAADVCEYQLRHPAFPQEPTADQFFDEAQWESYRRLGLELAMRVFPGPSTTAAYRDAFAQIF